LKLKEGLVKVKEGYLEGGSRW